MRKNQVILIHGMPATGKYTMAKRLQEQGGILLDNHYFHDMFAHSTEVPKEDLPEYWKEVGRLKKQFMKILARFYPKSEKVRYIFTSVMLKDEDLLERMEEFATQVHADFIPIELVARDDVLKNRCQADARRARKKISSATNMESFLKEHQDQLPDYTHPNKLRIDVSTLNEDETFVLIQKHLAKFDQPHQLQAIRNLPDYDR